MDYELIQFYITKDGEFAFKTKRNTISFMSCNGKLSPEEKEPRKEVGLSLSDKNSNERVAIGRLSGHKEIKLRQHGLWTQTVLYYKIW